MTAAELHRPLVRAFLEREVAEAQKGCYSGTDWSVQGMGMLRCYLPTAQEGDGSVATTRLHVWDDRLRVPNVSMAHTHPWDMESLVVSGRIVNHRYLRARDYSAPWPGMAWYEQDLRCGEGGHRLNEPHAILVHEVQVDEVGPGEVYLQRAEEIHISEPSNGAVTIVHRRVRPGANPDNAFVFWPAPDGRDGWVSAEPRPAATDEVYAVLADALDGFAV